MVERSGEYVVCPFCGYQHGDAWEWCKSKNTARMNCEGCGREFFYWAEVDVQYVSKRPTPEVTAKLREILAAAGRAK